MKKKTSDRIKGATRDHQMDELEPSEEDVFSQAMADVTPVAKGRQQRPSVQQTGPTPGQLKRRADAENTHSEDVDPNYLTLGEVLPVAPLAFLEWKKDGVQQAVFDKLRKDGYGIEASLDLHRKTVKEARLLLFSFLAQASGRGKRCVLISPGKGELSRTPGRLKSYLNAWLMEHKEVIAFCSAQRYHGGVGSVYVLVKKSAQSRELNREMHGLQSDLTDGSELSEP